MLTILYTTTDEVRATLGLDDTDVSDTKLYDQNLDLQMLERLETVSPTHETLNLAGGTPARRLKLWCQYYGALLFVRSSAFAVLKSHHINTDQLTRYDVDWDTVGKNLEKQVNLYEAKLLGTDRSTLAYPLFGSVAPSFNPVTGETTES